jgi:IS1 family transposase
MIAWMGVAMMVSTRLWLAGTVSVTRDKGLADALMHQVRRPAQTLGPLLVLTDGWAAYSGSIGRLWGKGTCLNTAFIERLNGTIRERLASLTRKCRHSASRLRALHTGIYVIGCTYNFSYAHQELSKAKHWGRACTPAMARSLTDHIWSVCELLRYKVVPVL